jgi:hypothetical protein
MHAQGNRTSKQSEAPGETGLEPAGAYDGDACIEDLTPHTDLAVELPDGRRRQNVPIGTYVDSATNATVTY